MAKSDIPETRPKFKVHEARMLLHILRAAHLAPDALEEAQFRERLQDSLIKFLAINGKIESIPAKVDLSTDEWAALESQFKNTDPVDVIAAGYDPMTGLPLDGDRN